MPAGPGRAAHAVRVALVAALLAALSLAPAALADNRTTALFDPAVSPTSATTATEVTFSVSVRGPLDAVSGYVAVIVGPTSHPLQRQQGSSGSGTGTRFSVSMQLPAGTWAVTFVAGNPQHPPFSIAGPPVSVVAAVAPPPQPAPPTAAPAPVVAAPAQPAAPSTLAAPRPAPAPAVAAPHQPAVPTTVPAITLSTAPHGAVLDAEAWNDVGSTDPAAVAWGFAAGHHALGDLAVDPPPDVASQPDIIPAGDALAGNGLGGDASPGGAPSLTGAPSLMGAPGLAYGATPPASVLAAIARAMPTALATTGAVSMLMGFLMFGKRRRDEEPTGSDEDLSTAAAFGVGMPLYTALLATIPAPVEAEADMPRWRRPSLMAARKADPLRTASTEVHLRFSGAAGDVLGGLERRLIRYRLVPLLDAPDEVRGTEIDVLDQGDEVVLLERRGTYRRVLCPDGVEGWLHQMTLGEVVEAGGDPPAMIGDDEVGLGSFESILRLAARDVQ